MWNLQPSSNYFCLERPLQQQAVDLHGCVSSVSIFTVNEPIMSLLNSTLQTLVVRLRDLTGAVSVQKLHNRIFDAYEAKSLVLESLTIPQQHVFIQHRGLIPYTHPCGQPLVIDSWQELVAQHQETHVYQLLPRKARTNLAYQVTRAVCGAQGSPFSMEQHRLDPVEYKFIFRQSDIELKNQYNLKNSDKVPGVIHLDGILSTPADVALVMAYPGVTPAHVNQLAGSAKFMKEWSNEPSDSDRHRMSKTQWKELLNPTKRMHLICGTVTPVNRELVNYARNKGVLIYAKSKTGHFIYQA